MHASPSCENDVDDGVMMVCLCCFRVPYHKFAANHHTQPHCRRRRRRQSASLQPWAATAWTPLKKFAKSNPRSKFTDAEHNLEQQNDLQVASCWRERRNRTKTRVAKKEATVAPFIRAAMGFGPRFQEPSSPACVCSISNGALSRNRTAQQHTPPPSNVRVSTALTHSLLFFYVCVRESVCCVCDAHCKGFKMFCKF